MWENARDTAGPEEEELIKEPRQRPVTPHLEGCAGTHGQWPVSPSTLPLGWEEVARSSGAAPGLSADQPGSPPQLRVWEKTQGLLGVPGGSGSDAAGIHWHLLAGDAAVGAPFQNREEAVAVLMPLC